MDIDWRGPHSDLGNHGRFGEVHAKTSRGLFFIYKKMDISVFQQGCMFKKSPVFTFFTQNIYPFF
jgi:hypothetical protein